MLSIFAGFCLAAGELWALSSFENPVVSGSLIGGLLLFASLSLLVPLRIRRRQAELREEVHQRTIELERLTRLTAAINEAVTVEEVLDHLYENFSGILPYDRIGLALLDEDRIVLRAVWSRGKSEAIGIDRGYEAPLKKSSTLQETLDSGRPRLIRNLERYLEQHPDSESTRRILKEGIRSSLTCPLRARGVPVGFIFFSSFEPDIYDESHAAFLEQISGHLSLIVDKSRLHDDLIETKSRLEMANRELERLARIDPLTGLANRRAFDETLGGEWRRARRSGKPLTLIMIDVDHFKSFNDRFGHRVGDECLRKIADALSRTMQRASDLVARYGGEEMAVVLPNCTLEEGLALAERVRRKVERLDEGDGDADRYRVTISAGVATSVPDQDHDSDLLVQQADEALYEAKRRGRNNVTAHQSEVLG
ncbi:MAG: sensor domain-containing diguanylate cyclase [Thermoanaerobaculia bacterium]|nr:sensor domain-containing diguanylate cyclase [Thermoanaerobaculia bacterium]